MFKLFMWFYLIDKPTRKSVTDEASQWVSETQWSIGRHRGKRLHYTGGSSDLMNFDTSRRFVSYRDHMTFVAHKCYHYFIFYIYMWCKALCDTALESCYWNKNNLLTIICFSKQHKIAKYILNILQVKVFKWFVFTCNSAKTWLMTTATQ